MVVNKHTLFIVSSSKELHLGLRFFVFDHWFTYYTYIYKIIQ